MKYLGEGKYKTNGGKRHYLHFLNVISMSNETLVLCIFFHFSIFTILSLCLDWRTLLFFQNDNGLVGQYVLLNRIIQLTGNENHTLILFSSLVSFRI